MTTTLTAPPAQPSGGRLADPATAAAARRSANRRRAEYLSSVTTGLLSVHDVVAAAAAPDGAPLLRISLRQLLGAQPDWGKSRTEAAMTRLITVLGETRTDRDQTIGWLVDPRVRGARLLAFADATQTGHGPPWPGFPFAPSPFA
ncbi:hypothetical protein [Cellulosimicrobium sp. Marseille-Q4280]|uniref:hypothetical protein n=1 Tax=Cellulosimicrobium sp. Marseille-Q4280 TaxID=2937992 RepID=UPI00203C4FC2|nr:hypothetical protein [Cellulosimicrobium sp. Marseille-Q4280]